MWVTSSTVNILTPTAIALGNFDGVHLGHWQVLQPIISQTAREILPHPIQATVVTFNPHPQEFFTGQRRQLLTPLSEKIQHLEALGIEQLVLLPFDGELATLSPQEFVEKILVQQLQAKLISVGADFCFGYKRLGTAEDLATIAAQSGVIVNIVALKTNFQGVESVRISSSLIRQALAEGNISQANQMLGRAYSLTGKVILGQQLGRTLGFPTANLQLPLTKLLPRFGVYGARVYRHQDGKMDKNPALNGVVNVGCRPTVNGNSPTVEVHLLDWTGDLYGQTLTVSLEHFIRPEQKFPSLEALKSQITADSETARGWLKGLG